MEPSSTRRAGSPAMKRQPSPAKARAPGERPMQRVPGCSGRGRLAEGAGPGRARAISGGMRRRRRPDAAKLAASASRGRQLAIEKRTPPSAGPAVSSPTTVATEILALARARPPAPASSGTSDVRAGYAATSPQPRAKASTSSSTRRMWPPSAIAPAMARTAKRKASQRRSSRARSSRSARAPAGSPRTNHGSLPSAATTATSIALRPSAAAMSGRATFRRPLPAEETAVAEVSTAKGRWRARSAEPGRRGERRSAPAPGEPPRSARGARGRAPGAGRRVPAPGSRDTAARSGAGCPHRLSSVVTSLPD